VLDSDSEKYKELPPPIIPPAYSQSKVDDAENKARRRALNLEQYVSNDDDDEKNLDKYKR
jgi:hypothetical protein